jgi:RNA polymerase sigma factor (TIGR02999 family)
MAPRGRSSSFGYNRPIPVEIADDQVTLWLRRSAAGDREASERLAGWASERLEELARRRMRRRLGTSSAGLTLEPAALVNETFLKLLDAPMGFDNRRHFLSFANQVMLRVLIDYQRSRGAAKRAGGAVRVTLSGHPGEVPGRTVDFLAFEQALRRLEALDPRKAEVVKLRLFWGFEMADVAGLLEVSVPTVQRDWRFAKTWLAEELELAP